MTCENYPQKKRVAVKKPKKTSIVSAKKRRHYNNNRVFSHYNQIISAGLSKEDERKINELYLNRPQKDGWIKGSINSFNKQKNLKETTKEQYRTRMCNIISLDNSGELKKIFGRNLDEFDPDFIKNEICRTDFPETHIFLAENRGHGTWSTCVKRLYILQQINNIN